MMCARGGQCDIGESPPKFLATIKQSRGDRDASRQGFYHLFHLHPMMSVICLRSCVTDPFVLLEFGKRDTSLSAMCTGQGQYTLNVFQCPFAKTNKGAFLFDPAPLDRKQHNGAL